MNAPRGQLSVQLRAAAKAFCPPLELAVVERADTRIIVRSSGTREDVSLRYRSERGLFLRTYFLVLEADISGGGPSEPGELVLRRGRLRWRRPRPRDGRAWSERLNSSDLLATLRPLHVERMRVGWEPCRSRWHVALETLSGSLTATFFPPLVTPNPLTREEAEAFLALLDALRRSAR